MAEHFLNGSEVGSALEEMGGEGVAEEVGVDAFRLQARLPGQPLEDEEGPRTRQGAALRVEEELRPVPRVEERPAAREVAAKSVDRFPADRHDPLLRALAEAADEAAVEVDGGAVEADRLADPEPGAVHELDERAVAHRPR